MDDTRPSSRRPSSRRRVLIAAAVLVAVLLVAGVVYLGRNGATSPSAPPPAATAAPSSAPSPSTPAPSTSPGSDAVPAATPQNVTWMLYRGFALPTSPTAGPSRIDGPVHAGYAHTPKGALMAASQITVRDLVTPDGGWRQVLDEQVVAGPGREAYANLRGQVGDTPPSTGYAQYAGFRFATYTSDTAVISLANKTSRGTYQVTNTTVQWVDGDWKLEIPASGQSQTQAVQSIVGYVPWSGVS